MAVEGRASRPWTRLGTVAIAGHVFYELAAGVAMPFASRFGVGTTAAVYGTSSVVAFRQAGRQPRSRDAAFCLLNGAFLSIEITLPFVLAPWLIAETPREFERPLVQARRHPRWWNRRLQQR